MQNFPNLGLSISTANNL